MNQGVFLLAIIIILVSCGGDNNLNAAPDKKLSQEKVAEKVDSAKWIDDFRAFRDAVYQNNRKKVKTFIDFPITEHTSYIWEIVGDTSKHYDDGIPFTEKDFDKYYDKLFTKIFIKCLLKIKSEELYKKGKVSSPEIKEKETTYTLNAIVREGNTLHLNLFAKGSYEVSKGEYDVSEFDVIYCFTILKNGKIKMSHILAAG